MSSGKPPRECVKVLHIGFAATREIGLSSEIGREMAGDNRDEDEERKLNQMLRVLHEKAVDRRIEEEG